MQNQRMATVLVSLFVIAGITAAAGCAKQGDKPQGAAQPAVKKVVFDPKNPCNLLTKEEVEAVMKQKIEAPKLEGGDCIYQAEDETKYSSLTIYVQNSADPAGQIKDMHNALQSTAQKDGRVVKKLDGIGDYAFVASDDVQNLHVVKGKIFLQFAARGNKGHILSEDGVKVLARQAVDKL